MNILVSIKQVPDTTNIRINPETGTLVREGIPSIINPYDVV
ncbi:MAG: electron transfer flavoprotein subunit beta, partial [bacterium]